MTTPVKVGTRWRHRVMVNGVRVSGTFVTKAAALKWEAQQRLALADGHHTTVNKTCADAFRRYELGVSRTKRGHRWEAKRLAAFGASSLATVTMAELSATHLAAWRDERLRSVTGATVTREMNLLSHVFSVVRREWGWLSTNPTTDVIRPPPTPPRDRRVTQDAPIIRVSHRSTATGMAGALNLDSCVHAGFNGLSHSTYQNSFPGCAWKYKDP